MNALRDKYLGCLLGLAAGDALGTTVEFSPRGSFEPLTDMVGGGPFRLAPGQWTDDTSMALCLAASLLEQGGFDPADQMRRYVAWMERGYLSSTGSCFDIGMTVRAALGRFAAAGDPYSGSLDARSAGNGSLMRLAPVVLYYHPQLDQVLQFAAQSSRTTHGAAEAVQACQLFAEIVCRAIDGVPRHELLSALQFQATEPAIAALASGAFIDKPESAIRGSGYCVASLEAALWCFFNTDDFSAAVLAAANLGDDADTTAAIAGQLAGAYYGATAIPSHWREMLSMRDTIEDMAVRLGERRA